MIQQQNSEQEIPRLNTTILFLKTALEREAERHEQILEENKRRSKASLTSANNVENEQHKENIRGLVAKYAKEWMIKHNEEPTALDAFKKTIFKEGLCRKSTYYYAIQSDSYFVQFKHKTGRPTKSDVEESTETIVSTDNVSGNSSPESETVDSGPEEPSDIGEEQDEEPEKESPLDESNHIRSLMGQLMKKLLGPNKESIQTSDTDAEVTFRRKVAERSKPHLMILAERIPEGQADATIGMIQTLKFLMEAYEQVLSDVIVYRKNGV